MKNQNSAMVKKNKEKSVYQGPVKKGYDEKVFRKTGRHIKKSLSIISILLVFFFSLVSVNAVLIDSLAYWSLNNTLTDLSGNGYILTNNGATYTASGKLGGGYNFDGSTQYMSSGITSLDTTYTFNFWVKFDDTTTHQRPFWFYKDTNNQLGIEIVGGEIHATHKVGGNLKQAETEYTDTTRFHMVTMIVNGSNMQLIIDNGTPVTQSGLSTSSLTGITYNLGRSAQPFGYFNGIMDEVSIYDRVLTTTEISELYNSGTGLNPYITNTSGGGGNESGGGSSPSALTPENEWYFSLDSNNISGSTAVDSAGRFHGTITGATTNSSGKLNQSLTFDGTGDYVTITNNGSLQTNTFTMDAWVYADSTQSGTQSYFFWKDVAGVNNGDWSAVWQSNDTIGFIIQNASTTNALHTTNALNTDQWYYVAVTYNGSTANLYLDGVLHNTMEVNATPSANTNDMRFGGAPSFNSLTGSMDEVAYWSRVLNASEISDRYNAGTGLNFYLTEINYTPTIIVNSPINGTVFNETPINFNVTVNDNSENETLNVSFYNVQTSTSFGIEDLSASFTTGYEDIGGVYDDVVDTFFIFGGDTVSASTNVIRSYNKTSNTLNNSYGTLPTNMFFGQEACINRWGTGESYCYGGRTTQTNTEYDEIIRFTSNNNSAVWITETLSQEKYFGCAVYDSSRDVSYYIGGYDRGNATNVDTIEIHNFTAGNVTTSSATLGAKLGQLGCFYDTANDYVVIMGGTQKDTSTQGYYPKTQIYYPGNDTVEVLGASANLPYSGADSLNCEYMESDGNGYCFGSITSSYFSPYTYRDDIIRWNTTAQTWSILGDTILDAVEDFPAVLDRSTNNAIYLFGVLQAGSNDNDVSKMTETMRFTSSLEEVLLYTETNVTPGSSVNYSYTPTSFPFKWKANVTDGNETTSTATYTLNNHYPEVSNFNMQDTTGGQTYFYGESIDYFRIDASDVEDNIWDLTGTITVTAPNGTIMINSGSMTNITANTLDYGTNLYLDLRGVWTVSISVTDTDGGSASYNTNFTVQNNLPTISNETIDLISLTGGNQTWNFQFDFDDFENDTLATCGIYINDGNLTESQNGTSSCNFNITYPLNATSYSIQTFAIDSEGGVSTDGVNFTLADIVYDRIDSSDQVGNLTIQYFKKYYNITNPNGNFTNITFSYDSDLSRTINVSNGTTNQWTYFETNLIEYGDYDYVRDALDTYTVNIGETVFRYFNVTGNLSTGEDIPAFNISLEMQNYIAGTQNMNYSVSNESNYSSYANFTSGSTMNALIQPITNGSNDFYYYNYKGKIVYSNSNVTSTLADDTRTYTFNNAENNTYGRKIEFMFDSLRNASVKVYDIISFSTLTNWDSKLDSLQVVYRYDGSYNQLTSGVDYTYTVNSGSEQVEFYFNPLITPLNNYYIDLSWSIYEEGGTITPEEPSSGGGGGGGGGGGSSTPSTDLNTGKIVCDVFVTPKTISLDDSELLQELRIKNDETFGFDPEFSFQYVSGDSDLVDKLRITNELTLVDSGKEALTGVRLSTFFLSSGEAKGNLVISSTKCVDIKVPITVQIEQDSGVAEIIKEVVQENKSISEVVVDLSDKSFFGKDDTTPIENKLFVDKAIDKVFSVLGLILIVGLLMLVVVVPTGKNPVRYSENTFLDITARFVIWAVVTGIVGIVILVLHIMFFP